MKSKFEAFLDCRSLCSNDVTKIIFELRKKQGFQGIKLISFSDEFQSLERVQVYRSFATAVAEIKSETVLFLHHSLLSAGADKISAESKLSEMGQWVQRKDLLKSVNTDNLPNITSIHRSAVSRQEPRKKILYVTHTDINTVVGGVQYHVSSLIRSLPHDHNAYVIYKSGNFLILENYIQGRLQRQTYEIKPTSSSNEFYCSSIENSFKAICNYFKFDAIHFHHIIGLPWSLFTVAKRQSKNVLFTIHDYYSYCQRYDLINSRGEHCGFSKSDKVCGTCVSTTHIFEPYSFQKNAETFSSRRAKIKDVLKGVTLIAPSQNVYDNLIAKMNFPSKQVHLMEHSIAKSRSDQLIALTPDHPIGIAFVGSFSTKKGAEVFLKIVSEWDQKKIPVRWNVFGKVTEVLIADQLIEKYNVKFHGPYKVLDLPKHFKTHRINVGLVLSIWPETFSYVLNDILQAGAIPISTNIGAPADRILGGGFGWTVDLAHPTVDLKKIISSVLSQPNLLNKKFMKKPQEDDGQKALKLFEHYGP